MTPILKRCCVYAGVEGTENMTVAEYREAACNAVAQLSKDVGIPQDLKGIVKEEDIDFLAQSAMDDACRPATPRIPPRKIL